MHAMNKNYDGQAMCGLIVSLVGSLIGDRCGRLYDYYDDQHEPIPKQYTTGCAISNYLFLKLLAGDLAERVPVIRRATYTPIHALLTHSAIV